VKRAISKGKHGITIPMTESTPSLGPLGPRPTIQPMLWEFKDVFPHDLPLSLPPKRGIEQQIDLTPGAS